MNEVIVNLWSPSGDEDDIITNFEIIQSFGNFKSEQHDDVVDSINVSNIIGKQIYDFVESPQNWSREGREALGFIIKNHINGTLSQVIDNVPPTLSMFAEYLNNAGNITKKMFNHMKSYLIRDPVNVIKTNKATNIISDVVDELDDDDDEPNLLTMVEDIKNSAINKIREGSETLRNFINQLFGNINLFEINEDIPDWIDIKSGDFIDTCDNNNYGKKQLKNIERLKKEGYTKFCAYMALCVSGVPNKFLDPEEFKNGINVEQFIKFLNKHDYNFILYDQAGNIVIEQDNNTRKCLKFIIAKKHIYPIKSKIKECINIVSNHLTNNDELENNNTLSGVHSFQIFERFFNMRGCNSLAVEHFYKYSNLRAPRFRTNKNNNGWIVQPDQSQAYRTIITDNNNVFPVFEGTEYIEDCEICDINYIKRSGFYLVHCCDKYNVLPNKIWMLGECIKRNKKYFVVNQNYPIIQKFIPRNTVSGKKPSEKINKEIYELAKKEFDRVKHIYNDEEYKRIHNTKDITPEKIIKHYYRMYTGYIEGSRSEKRICEMNQLDTNELKYLTAASFQNKNYLISISNMIIKHKRYKKTGKPAKLGIYCYQLMNNLNIIDEIKQEFNDINVIGITTDSVTCNITNNDELENNNSDELKQRMENLPSIENKKFHIENIYYYKSEIYEQINTFSQKIREGNYIFSNSQNNNSNNLFIYGPPGCGKSYFIKNNIIPYETNNVIFAVPTIELMNEVKKEYNNVCTVQSIVKSSIDFNIMKKIMSQTTLIIDEAGLCEPSAFTTIHNLRPKRLILVGDPFQLNRVGNLFKIAELFNCFNKEIKPHNNDRFVNKEMYEILDIIKSYIDPKLIFGRNKWNDDILNKINKINPTLFINELPDYYYSQVHHNNIILGFRRKYTAEDKKLNNAYTIHSSQGKTFNNDDYHGILLDYYTDPRILYTGLSRFTNIDNIKLVLKIYR